MKAVIYCRVSTKEQLKNKSLPTQEKACRDYCATMDFKVDRVFMEEGESAKTLNRTQIKKMLEYCRKKKPEIGFVVVYTLSRFARDTHAHHELRARLQHHGVKLRSVTEPIDESSTGLLMENIVASMAQFDNNLKSDRAKAGMRAAAERGRWVSRVPIGYTKNGDYADQSVSLVLNSEQAPLVLTAFELIATGAYSQTQVLDKIKALGFRHKNGNSVGSQTFSKMLRNPIYAGWVRIEKWDFTGPGDFEAIVAQEIFDKVQLILDGKKPVIIPRLRNHPDYPLRHFVRCAACEVPLTGSGPTKESKIRYRYYHCRNSDCQSVSIRKELMEQKFFDLLASIQPRVEFVGLFKAIVTDVWKKRHAEAYQHRNTLEKRIQGLLERGDKLVEAHIYNRIIGRDEFQRQKGRLKEETRFIQNELNEARAADYDVEKVLEFAENILLNAPRLWREYELDNRQRFQQLIFPKGLEFDGENYRTAPTCGMFTYLQQIGAANDDLASPTGIEPVLPP